MNILTDSTHKPKGEANYTLTNNCRFCGSGDLESILDLGNPCISDFIAPGGEESRVPLELLFCNSCGLVQLRHTVDRDWLYRDYYYQSSTNESMITALQNVVRDALDYVDLKPGDTVVDIGANDFTLLKQYNIPELFKLGFEPAINMLHHAGPGIYFYPGFFPPVHNEKLVPWESLVPSQPKIITSIAMFYDLDDPDEFVEQIKSWLHPDGVWVVQFQDLDSMLTQNAFDNICHEHLLYIDHNPFLDLLSRHGLGMVGFSRNSVNGGSSRYIIKHTTEVRSSLTPKWSLERLYSFRSRVEMLRDAVPSYLGKWAQDNVILGYGASTKGNTLLQYCDVDSSLVAAIADRNSEKWNRVTVGSHIPIISEEEMRARKPSHLFVLPWHFINAFKEREHKFLARGGQFIVPLPNLRIVSQ